MRFTLKLLCAALVVAAVTFGMIAEASAGGLGSLVGASTLWLGGQATTFPTGTVVKNDVEGFGALSVSLSPHISATGSVAEGFQHGYTRASAGARFTVHDNAAHTVSAGVGIEHQWYSDFAVGADEWVGKSVIGWDAQEWLNFTGTGAYGLTSHELRASLAAQIPITALR